jgi:putative transposase
MRRSPKVPEVLPILYLRGLATGDFRPALEALLGADECGLPPPNIARLTAGWKKEYADFRRRDLSGREYVYIWVDGVRFNLRLEDDRLWHPGDDRRAAQRRGGVARTTAAPRHDP